jgi:hypothetical protein
VNWELTREPQRHEQTRTTTRTESAAKPNKKKRRG